MLIVLYINFQDYLRQIIQMSHKLEGTLILARTYQLPLWMYSPHEEFNPYLLSSLGFRPVARNLLQCHICMKEIAITEQLESQPKQMLQFIKIHEQNCIYNNQQSSKITKEQLYLSMDEIIAEMDLNKTFTAYPLLNRQEILKFIGVNSFLFKKVLNLYEMSYQNFKITFILKMLGWYLIKNEEEKECLACYFCGRNISVDKYKTIAEDKQDIELEKTTPEEELFNPVNEHRYFCFIANREENWLVYLQHQENKFLQTCSFKSKTAPLESQRMRFQIDKYVESTKEKIETGLLKLKTLTHQCGLLCSQLGEDKNLGLEADEQEMQLKRFRDHEHSLQLVNEHMSKELDHPLKRIKFN